MKNITLSADPELIKRSRDRAQRENTTLNEVFRRWLQRYAGQEALANEYQEIMTRLAYADAGRTFNREEMNER